MADIHLHVKKNESRFMILERTPPKLIVTDNKKYILLIQQQGLPGAASDLQTITLGEDVSRGNILYLNAGKFYKASNNTQFILDNPVISFAFANSDGFANSQIQVRKYGNLFVPSAGFTSDTFYYLGVNGGIINTPPTSGLLMLVGQAITTQDLLIEWGTPILVGL